jgi:hypothetical protein
MAARQRAARARRSAWRPGRRAETLLIALLIQGLTALTLLVADRVYAAGLAAVARPGQTVAWLLRPGEAGLVLLLALTAGAWLTGVWLGERQPRAWAGLAVLTALLTAPLLLALDQALGVTRPGSRFAPPGLGPETLWLLAPAVMLAGIVLGGLVGAWWSGLTPGPAE